MRKVLIYENGVEVVKEIGRVSSSGSVTGCPRGCIDSFSYSARLRLRLALLRYFLPGGFRVGVTLTLPWSVSDWSAVMGDFRSVMHRFRVYWLRRFKDCGAIFRVELQRRGAPHLHMVAWHRKGTLNLSEQYFALWYDSLLRDLRGGSYSDFARYGVKVDTLPNVIASIRYLCDHASKSKQAQLGYRGKQWGILGKASLRVSTGEPFSLSDRQFVLLGRWLRRLTRFRVTSDCVFGSRLSKPRRTTRVVYISDYSVHRLLSVLLHIS